jgi:hypothetical protein
MAWAITGAADTTRFLCQPVVGCGTVSVTMTSATSFRSSLSRASRRFSIGDDGEWLRVVGVVADLRLMGRDQRDGPYQILHPSSPEHAGRWVEVAVRTAGDPGAVLAAVREAVRAIDSE